MPTRPAPNLLKLLTERRASLVSMFVLMLAAAFMAPLHAQTAFDLPQLTQLLSQMKSGEAVFKEKRTVDLLERSLESSGRLSFSSPDTFVRETLKPRHEKIAVVGNSVTLSSGSRSRTVPLDSVPEAAVIVEAIRGTLTGNRELLQRNFNTTVSGNAKAWQLELVPIEPRVRELVRSVQIGGQQALVRDVTVIMSDGDRSIMTIEPMVAPPKPASAAN